MAIITGAGSHSGIGFASATILARAGAKVFITSTTERIFDRVRELKDLVGSSMVEGLSADLTEENQVLELIRATVKRFSKVDILVNNAGMVQVGVNQPSKRFRDLDSESWDYGMNISLKSAFLVTRHALPEIQKQKMGRIINISSVTGPLVGIDGSTTYSSAKAGLLGLTRSLAIEEGTNRITVNCVCPGWIKTGSSTEDEILAGNFTPIGRTGTPEEVGHAVLFLASSEASYITGQMLVVDGGNTVQEYKVQLNRNE